MENKKSNKPGKKGKKLINTKEYLEKTLDLSKLTSFRIEEKMYKYYDGV
jgi:hypothetical protein